MKKALSFLSVALLACFITFAQAPNKINYQGIARSASGGAISGATIKLRLTIHSGSASGAIVYQETQSTTTNTYGLYNVAIGQGTTVTGSFPAIDWSISYMWLQVEMDPSGGTSYVDMGTAELNSVPYAIYANNANTAVNASYATSASSASYAGIASALSGTVPMAGDVSGNNTANVVNKIQGRNVSPVAPTGGQVLTWDATTMQWVPGAGGGGGGTGTVTSITATPPLTGGTITTSGSIGLGAIGTAGTYGSATQVPVITTDLYGRVTSAVNTGITVNGDITGTAGATYVSKLQGNPVAATAPAIGDNLQWNGTDWVPAAGGTGTVSSTMAGDVTGTTSANTITSLQGNPVLASAPTVGSMLEWNGTDWVPMATSGITLAGDVTGTTGANTISSIQGKPVLAPAPLVGDVLEWNGTDWVPTPAAAGATGLSGNPPYLVKFTSATTGGNSSIIDSTGGLFYNTTSFLSSANQTMEFDGVSSLASAAFGNWMSFEGNTNSYSYLTVSDPVNSSSLIGCPKGIVFTDQSSIIDGMAGADNAAWLAWVPWDATAFSGDVLYMNGMNNGFSVTAMTADMTTGNVNFPNNVNVGGTLSKTAGTFKIDHPQDPENKYLYHSFVESPDMMNIYNGNITTDASGLATVDLPGYFEAENIDFRYQLTVIGATFAQAIVSQEIADNRFQIKTNMPNTKVSWQVTGVRNDKYAQAHRVVPEVEKEAKNKGKYISPTEWGKPASAGINYEESKKAALTAPKTTSKNLDDKK